MKIIYFGSSVPINSIQSILSSRCLMGSKAVIQREGYILSVLEHAASEDVGLTFVSTAYGKAKGPFNTQRFECQGNEIVCLGYTGSKYLRHISSYVVAFFWVMQNFNHGDLAITYNFPPLYAIPLLIKKLIFKRKLIIEFEDFYNSSDIKHYFYGPFERLGIICSDAFIASSKGMREHIQSRRPAVKVVVNGGYLTSYREVIGASKYVATPPYTILYSGSLDAERGIDNLLESFQRNSSKTFKLMFSGNGPLSDNIIAAAAKDERIQYLGLLNDDDYLNAISSADVCISSQWSSISVNFPSKITMYLSLGKIVLSTKIDSLFGSEYRDLLVFYDDQNDDDLWSKLCYIKENMVSLTSASTLRIEGVHNIFEKQKSELLQLVMNTNFRSTS